MKNNLLGTQRSWRKTASSSLILMLIAYGGLPALRVDAADKFWTGSQNQNWNHNNNWSPNGEPTSGDTAVFQSNGVIAQQPHANANNLSALGIDFRGTGGWVLGGNNNVINVYGGGIDQSGSGTNRVQTPIGLAASSTWSITGGTLSIERAISGVGANSLTKDGSGLLIMTAANTYAGSTTVSGGTLLVNGSIATSSGVTVGTGAFLGGSGATSRISGAGMVAPGSTTGISAGILTASSLNGAAGLDFTFDFTRATIGGVSTPIYGSATASGNDVLRLTDTTAFVSSLTSQNTVNVNFSGLTLTLGDRYLGGFFTTSNTLLNISPASFAYTGLGAGQSISVSMVQQTADFGGGAVNGYITQFTVIPEPSTVALLAFGGVGMLLGFQKRRMIH